MTLQFGTELEWSSLIRPALRALPRVRLPMPSMLLRGCFLTAQRHRVFDEQTQEMCERIHTRRRTPWSRFARTAECYSTQLTDIQHGVDSRVRETASIVPTVGPVHGFQFEA